MSSWEDELIAELQQRASAPGTGLGGSDPLARAFAGATQAFTAAISRIAEATGTVVETRGAPDEGRLRWSCGPRTLTLRADPASARLVASADLGASLEIDELTVDGEQLLDARGRPATADDLAQRFVPLLFRGR